MKRNGHKALLFSAFVLISGLLGAEEPAAVARPYIGEIVDTPTADVVDQYGYNVNFRFGKDGNLQTKTAFGIFPHLNLGFGLDGERVMGTGTSRMNKPTINVKFQLFDGRKNLPMLALGYDGQGYEWLRGPDEYEQREKGLYLVGTKEAFVRGLLLNAGVNVFDFDKGNSTRGFIGWSYLYENLVGLYFEWDSVTNYSERRINYGAKYFITPAFSIDFAARNIRENPAFHKRETERIIRLNYTGSF
jgi:hypothetical protein